MSKTLLPVILIRHNNIIVQQLLISRLLTVTQLRHTYVRHCYVSMQQ
jgi:hypothetical protein